MKKVLMSIHPQYVNRILSGEKKYEYRKVKCDKAVESLLIYATTPVKKVVAEVEVIDVMTGDPDKIWTVTKEFSGIGKPEYDKYYNDRKIAVAYILGKVNAFDEPKELSEYGIASPPQSYVYVYDNLK